MQTDRRPVDGRSHVIGRRDEPLWDRTIPATLAATVDRLPDHEAAVFREQGIRKTYRELAAEALRKQKGRELAKAAAEEDTGDDKTVARPEGEEPAEEPTEVSRPTEADTEAEEE